MRLSLAFRVVALLAIAFLLLACTPGAHGPSSAEFDRQFIDMMVPHHQGAVAMANIARERAERPEIRAMAEAIIASQDDEIRLMRRWRGEWFGSDETPPMQRMPMVPGLGEHSDGHATGTMNMAAEVAALRAAPGPFDHAFIDAMIPHHASAIEAGQAAETRAQRQEIKQLAVGIVADQQREIAQMEQWRNGWFGPHSH